MESGNVKITVTFQAREDGGLRAWSPDVPGLVLSGADPAKVMEDLVPAIEAILEQRLDCEVRAFPHSPPAVWPASASV